MYWPNYVARMIKTVSYKLSRTGMVSLLLILIAGCSSTLPLGNEQVMIAKGVRLTLTPPPSELVGQSFEQVLAINSSTHNEVLITQLVFTKKGLILVAMTAQGVPIFELEYNHLEPIKVKKYVPLPGLDPVFILADIQLTNWPAKLLMENIQGATLAIDSSVGTRQIMQKRKIIINIENSKAVQRLHHYQRNYQLMITKA